MSEAGNGQSARGPMGGKHNNAEPDGLGDEGRNEFGLPDRGTKVGLLRRTKQRILEYWKPAQHRSEARTGRTLSLFELEVARIQEQRDLEKDLGERFDEPGIGERKTGLPFMAYLVFPVIAILIVGLPVTLMVRKIGEKELGEAPKRSKAEAVLPVGEGQITDQTAAEVAEAFLRAGTLEERLALVRDPERVRGRLEKYPAMSRDLPIEFVALQGAGLANANGEARFHRFAVRLADGASRFLPVVQTSRGPLVDYDAFARYGSAGWEDLLGGAAAEELRVVVQYSTYYVYGFEDEQKWMAFELSSPDWPSTLTGYAARNSPTASTLAAITGLRTKQRVTLAIRPEGESYLHRQVVIEKVLASGWVRTEGDLELRWGLNGRPAAGP